jgi:hypothetical protein
MFHFTVHPQKIPMENPIIAQEKPSQGKTNWLGKQKHVSQMSQLNATKQAIWPEHAVITARSNAMVN